MATRKDIMTDPILRKGGPHKRDEVDERMMVEQGLQDWWNQTTSDEALMEQMEQMYEQD